MTFIEMCLLGEVQKDQIGTFIEQWHAGLAGEDLELHDYLGFTWDEYLVWATTPSAIDSILQRRKHDEALASE